MRKFKELTQEEINLAIQKSKSIAETLQNLDCCNNGFNVNKLKGFISNFNIDISHFKTRLSKDMYLVNPKHCKYCGKEISYEKRNNDFCSHSCSASYNNIGTCRNGKPSEDAFCLNCGKPINKGTKYCNSTCYAEYQRKEYIKRWKAGKESGIIGTDDIATAIKIYLRELHNNSCQICGWNKVNPYTGIVLLQIHHIDGDCTNNKENNLQLLCPNCHSLTDNFGSRNKNCTRTDKRVR